MKFAVSKTDTNNLRDRIAKGIADEFKRHGHVLASIGEKVKFVLHLTNFKAPGVFLRKSRTEYIVSIAVLDEKVEDIRGICYTALIKTLANMFICIAPIAGKKIPEIYFITPEMGFYHYPFDRQRVYNSVMPLVSSHPVTENNLNINLPAKYWKGTPIVNELILHGHLFDTLGLLPAPFPLQEVLSKEDAKHRYDSFGTKGLSYGNLSVREIIPEIGENSFWMTARGVDKGQLKGIGHDIVLVTGFDATVGVIMVSVPPEHKPDIHASVDAIEHAMIYNEYREIGAVVHVHAWMEGIVSSRQVTPCGTRELAENAVRMLSQTKDPSRAVIGLKNHGITITGQNLKEIFNRVKGKLLKEVPMTEC